MKLSNFSLYNENSLNDRYFLNTILYRYTTSGYTRKMVTVDFLKL